jgi:hypothetical protein
MSEGKLAGGTGFCRADSKRNIIKERQATAGNILSNF